MSLTQEELIERAILLLKKEKFDDIDCIDIPPVERGFQNRRSIIYNFVEICKKLRLDDVQKVDHLKHFIDFKTTMKSTNDQSGKLFIVGRVEKTTMKDYIDEYMQYFIFCPTCESANTSIEKNGRLTFISCKKCDSKKAILGYTNFSELKLS